MALLAFYGGLVIGVCAGMAIMAMLAMARVKEGSTPEINRHQLQER